MNLRSDGGKEAASPLKEADVLVENYRRQTLPKLGFDYESLRQENPRLIYCAISGFGRTGPYADRGGFDLVAQAMSGIMSITGTSRNEPPVKCGPPLTDITAGLLAVIGILAALRNRETTGKGQMVETSLLEAGIIHTYWQSAWRWPRGGAGAHGLRSSPFGSYQPSKPATDGSWWRRQPCQLLRLVQVPSTASCRNLRFKTNADRGNLSALSGERLLSCPTPVAGSSEAPFLRPVNDVVEMHEDPQVQAREMVMEVPHTTLGAVRTLGLPIKFSDTPGGPRRGAPLLGEHTREVLAEHGFAPQEIDQLVAEGAVIAADIPPRG